MAYDSEKHEIDPVTGFAVHKDTESIVGVVPRPRRPTEPVIYPAWIKPHQSHIIRKKVEGAPDDVSCPGFESRVDPVNGEVTVLVNDAAHEAVATLPRNERKNVPTGDYPTWVAPHESHVERKKTEGAPDHVSCPGFETSVNRVNGEVRVLVLDADHEKVATDAKQEAKVPDPPLHAPPNPSSSAGASPPPPVPPLRPSEPPQAAATG
jgi:hypothetical protein